jgi:TetR/AcrR family transcriptional regulator, mexCD-oprJ operon repressor
VRQSQPPPTALRVDARRNRDRVLEAALHLLAERPTASLQEIADAAGVGRRTLYRRFPSRTALLTHIEDSAVQEIDTALAAARPGDDSAQEAFERVTDAVVGLAQRYRLLALAPHLWEAGETRTTLVLHTCLRDLITRGQEEAHFRTDLPAAWLATFVSGTLFAAVRAQEHHEFPQPLTVLLRSTLHGGLTGLG